MWSGSAFMCQAREISLRHGRFNQMEAIGSCNDGAIVGRGVASNGDQYTSQLDVTLSSGLIGRTVTCSVDDGVGSTEIGTTTLAVNATSEMM